jgi:plasmid stability protein
MPDLNIRNVDAELIRDVKIIAAKQDANMREMVIHILQAYVNRFTARLEKKAAK